MGAIELAYVSHHPLGPHPRPSRDRGCSDHCGLRHRSQCHRDACREVWHPRAVHAGKPGGNTVNPSITALIEFESGAAGVLILNNDAGGASEQVELHGGGLSVFLNITDHVLRYSDRTWGDERCAPVQWSEYRSAKWARFEELQGFSDLDRHFIDCVRSQCPPAAGAADAYRSHELAHRVYSEAFPGSKG